jgi:hypothetical protein
MKFRSRPSRASVAKMRRGVRKATRSKCGAALAFASDKASSRARFAVTAMAETYHGTPPAVPNRAVPDAEGERPARSSDVARCERDEVGTPPSRRVSGLSQREDRSALSRISSDRLTRYASAGLKSRNCTANLGGRMSTSSVIRAVETLVACGWLLGCSGASWRDVKIDSAYQPPKAITIAVIAPPSLTEASGALQAGLVDGLSSHGILATVIPETSGTPDANVTIAKWDPGSRGLRWLAVGTSGGGEIVVKVESASGIDGTARGWVHWGFFGGSSDNSAEAAGNMIADTIATGEADPDTRGNGHFSQ